MEVVANENLDAVKGPGKRTVKSTLGIVPRSAAVAFGAGFMTLTLMYLTPVRAGGIDGSSSSMVVKTMRANVEHVWMVLLAYGLGTLPSHSVFPYC